MNMTSVIRAKFVSVEHASARGAADRWKQQYWDKDMGWMTTASGPASEIYERLCALGPVPSIEAVAEVIGNKSWSYIFCHGCGDSVERGIRLGEYDGKVYCSTCISEAAQILAAIP